jgi:hypothetical protein
MVSASIAQARLVAEMVGHAPWQAILGHGTSATLDFGDRLPPVRAGAPARGLVHLWISDAAWRVERTGVTVGASDDSESKMLAALRLMESAVVKSVSLSEPGDDLVIETEDSVILRTFRISTIEDAWRFYDKSGCLFMDKMGKFQQEAME